MFFNSYFRKSDRRVINFNIFDDKMKQFVIKNSLASSLNKRFSRYNRKHQSETPVTLRFSFEHVQQFLIRKFKTMTFHFSVICLNIYSTKRLAFIDGDLFSLLEMHQQSNAVKQKSKSFHKEERCTEFSWIPLLFVRQLADMNNLRATRRCKQFCSNAVERKVENYNGWCN